MTRRAGASFNHTMLKKWRWLLVGAVVLLLLCCAVIAMELQSRSLAGQVNDYASPQMLATAALVLIGFAATYFAFQAFCAQRRSRIEDALNDVVAPEVLEKILAQPFAFAILPRECSLTVVAVDFVGFDAACETTPPSELFRELRAGLHDLCSCIHRYGGMVDKAFGNGVVGFFGYNMATHMPTEGHVDQGVKCALEMQKLFTARCRDRAGTPAIALPLRIGVNTGRAYLGDLGDDGRIDLSILGYTAHVAQSLQEAAEPTRILVGSNAQLLLQDQELKRRMWLRKAAVAFHKELIDAFELDPFESDPKTAGGALKAYREFAGVSRTMARIVVPPKTVWEIWIHRERIGQVLDYSAGGICVDLTRFYANKVILFFDLVVRGVPDLSDAPVEPTRTIPRLAGEVRWGRKVGEQFRHGLELTAESRAHLLDAGLLIL